MTLRRSRILNVVASIVLMLLFFVEGVQPALALAADPPPPVPVPAPTPKGTGDSQYLTPGQIAALNQAIYIANRTKSGLDCIEFYAEAIDEGRLPSPIPPDCESVIDAIKAMVPTPYGPQPSGITPVPVPTPSR